MIVYFWIIGNATSPNCPGTYTYNLEKTETVKVESGEIVLLWFTDFDVFALTEADVPEVLDSDTVVDVDPCPYDYVQVTDGDGTILMNKSCGYMKVDRSDPNYFLPANITSNTNMVDIFFKTDGNGARTGWSLSWRAMTPGPGHLPACPVLPPILGQRCDVAPAGPQDCYYAGNHFIFLFFICLYAGDHCCCGRCFASFVFSCVPGSSNGRATWQTTICPAEGCEGTGKGRR